MNDLRGIFNLIFFSEYELQLWSWFIFGILWRVWFLEVFIYWLTFDWTLGVWYYSQIPRINDQPTLNCTTKHHRPKTVDIFQQKIPWILPTICINIFPQSAFNFPSSSFYHSTVCLSLHVVLLTFKRLLV
jgi:hypothetical protein